MPIVSAPPPVKAKPASTTAARKTAATTSAREEALNGMGQLIQVPLIILKQHADAGAVGLHWKNVSHEVAKLAETQPAVAKIIDPLLQAGPYAGLIAAVLPFALQIAVNHGLVRPGAMSTVSAEVLSSQIESGLAQTELEALRIQQDAKREAARIRAEIEQSRKELQDAA